MSRLVLKNLPTNITEEKIRELFSQKGLLTDVQLKYTKGGKFRRFGFVGYKSEEEAQRALEFFDNTFINTCRIKVEICTGLGDPNKPKAWSKYAPDSSAYQKEHKKEEKNKEVEDETKTGKKRKKNVVEEALEKYKDDPMFHEFMKVHKKGNEGIWDDYIVNKEYTEGSDFNKESQSDQESEHAVSSEEEELPPTKKVRKNDISDLEYLKMKTVKETVKPDVQVDEEKENGSKDEIKSETPKKEKKIDQLYNVKVKGLQAKPKRKHIIDLFQPLKLKPESVRIPKKIHGIAYVGFRTEKEMKKALVKNSSFLGKNRLSVKRVEPTQNKLYGNMDKNWKEQEESLKNEESIAESGRLFVRNLPYNTSEEDIEKLFSKYGEVTEVIFPVDHITRRFKGFAIVTFLIPEHAAKAHMELDGSIFQGRMMHLVPGKSKLTIEEMLQKEGLSYKEKELLKKKAQAASSHNWNTLFLGQNAVVDLIAENYNTTKEQVLDSSGKESAAVRLALGETQIVQQMREFLEESGVHLDAFNQPSKQRSKTVILAKNLPAKTSLAEIKEMFMKFGELGRVILPPGGVTAIVEFLEPYEAKKAFMRLAYSRFKNLPLYLEWGPADTFTSPSEKKKEDDNAGKEVPDDESENKKEETKKEKKESSDEEDDAPEPNSTLFVKNLNFVTEKEQLMKHFEKCGPIHEVMVAKKKDPKNPGQLLSMGYGFVQFKQHATVMKALKTLQMSKLDGHALELKQSHRTAITEVKSARKMTKIGKQTGTKILVRNIPFEATVKEVQDLFKAFGDIKSVRLPKKMMGTGSHRGFGFVEFSAKHDAKRAFKALCQSTHLYGRRLALEWAATEDTIDDIRKRTASDFLLEGPKNKKLKKAVANPEIRGDSD